MPPWERERIPLIFINGQFACMPQVVIEESCRAGAGEVGLEIHLRDLEKTERLMHRSNCIQEVGLIS